MYLSVSTIIIVLFIVFIIGGRIGVYLERNENDDDDDDSGL